MCAVAGATLAVALAGCSGPVTVASLPALRPGATKHQVSLRSGAPVPLVVARGTDVVGEDEGGVGVPAIVTAGRPYRLDPASILLRGCPHRPIGALLSEPFGLTVTAVAD